MNLLEEIQEQTLRRFGEKLIDRLHGRDGAETILRLERLAGSRCFTTRRALPRAMPAMQPACRAKETRIRRT